MSDTAIDWMSQGGGSPDAPAVAPKTNAIDWMASGGPGSTADDSPDNWLGYLKKKASNIYGSFVEPAATIASGALAKPVSDVAGLAATAYNAATGNSDNELGAASPENFKKDIQDRLTYTPRTEYGKNAVQLAGDVADSTVGRVAREAGSFYGAVGGKLGLPDSAADALEHGVTETVNQVPNFIGARAVGGKEGIPRLDVPTPAPGSIAADAQAVIDKSAARQSGGAAGASANIMDASLPLQSRIAEADPAKIDPVALNNHLEADQHGVQLLKGQATRDPTQFSQEQNSTHPEIVERINAQNGQMTDALDNIRREASPTTVGNDHIENGQTVVDALKAYDEPIKADISAKYKALADANGGDLPVNGSSFKDAADAALSKQNKARYLPTEVQQTLEDIKKSGNFTYSQFEGLRTDLAAAGRKADRASDGNAKAAINITRQALEELPMTPKFNSQTLEMADPSGVKALADQARSAAKARFDELEADPAYEAAVNDDAPKGKPSALADTFLDKYAISKSTAPKANVDRMMSKLDDDAKGAVTSHTLNAIRKAGINPSGNVLPNSYNGAMEKLGPKLDSLVAPETKDSLESLGRVITNAKVAPPGSFVNYSKSGVVSNAAQGLGEAALNAKTLGLGVPVLKGMIKNHFAKDALAPGAGIER